MLYPPIQVCIDISSCSVRFEPGEQSKQRVCALNAGVTCMLSILLTGVGESRGSQIHI